MPRAYHLFDLESRAHGDQNASGDDKREAQGQADDGEGDKRSDDKARGAGAEGEFEFLLRGRLRGFVVHDSTEKDRGNRFPGIRCGLAEDAMKENGDIDFSGGAVELAHAAVRRRVFEGAVAVDATAGNGRDTLFLAREVGAGGKVFAVDLQAEAVTRTRALLEAEGLAERVFLRQGNHADLGALWPELQPRSVQAVMFNLGYLPGGNKEIITRVESTLAGLEQAATLLAPGGVLAVVCYPGHPGGGEESRAVCDWAERFSGDEYTCHVQRPSRDSERAPFLVTLEG